MEILLFLRAWVVLSVSSLLCANAMYFMMFLVALLCVYLFGLPQVLLMIRIVYLMVKLFLWTTWSRVRRVLSWRPKAAVVVVDMSRPVMRRPGAVKMVFEKVEVKKEEEEGKEEEKEEKEEEEKEEEEKAKIETIKEKDVEMEEEEKEEEKQDVTNEETKL